MPVFYAEDVGGPRGITVVVTQAESPEEARSIIHTALTEKFGWGLPILIPVLKLTAAEHERMHAQYGWEDIEDLQAIDPKHVTIINPYL